MKKRTFGTGAVSILLVFVILCLVAFGVLSLSTAQTGLGYAQTAADDVSAYYEASAQAERELASLTRKLSLNWENAPSQYPGELSQYTGDTAWTAEGDTLSLTLPLSGAKLLTVTVRPKKPENGRYAEILSYRTAPAQAWEADNTLPLLE